MLSLSHRMSPSSLASCILLISLVIVFGCKAKVPATSSSDPQSDTTSKVSSRLPAPLIEPETPFELEADFKPLTMADFESFDAQPETWQATSDGLTCTGKPKGYLYSRQSHQNFTLRLEYRFPRPENLKDDSKFKGNTGFLVYITGEHKLWPMCLEVQGKHVQMAAIKENGGAQPVMVDDDDQARQQARKPVGQWNAIEILSKDGVLQVTLNGTPISKSQPDFLSEGAIGIQAEDHPFEVRRMRIRTE